jgi:hypothetical protein
MSHQVKNREYFTLMTLGLRKDRKNLFTRIIDTLTGLGSTDSYVGGRGGADEEYVMGTTTLYDIHQTFMPVYGTTLTVSPI